VFLSCKATGIVSFIVSFVFYNNLSPCFTIDFFSAIMSARAFEIENTVDGLKCSHDTDQFAWAMEQLWLNYDNGDCTLFEEHNGEKLLMHLLVESAKDADAFLPKTLDVHSPHFVTVLRILVNWSDNAPGVGRDVFCPAVAERIVERLQNAEYDADFLDVVALYALNDHGLAALNAVGGANAIFSMVMKLPKIVKQDDTVNLLRAMAAFKQPLVDVPLELQTRALRLVTNEKTYHPHDSTIAACHNRIVETCSAQPSPAAKVGEAA
jgi:hypothetical protein